MATHTVTDDGLDAISDGTNVYYLRGGGDLWRVPVEGGTEVKAVTDGKYAGQFASNQTGGFPIAVDDTSVYVIAGYLGQIVKVAN